MNVFVSHATADRAFAERLANALEKGGHKVWTHRDLLPGDNWLRAIASALEEADALVALVSPHALESDSVKREWEYALGQKKFAGRLIPVEVPGGGEPRGKRASSEPWIFERLARVRGATPAAAAQQILTLLQERTGARVRVGSRGSG